MGRGMAAQDWAAHRAVRIRHCVSLALYILFMSVVAVVLLFLCGSYNLSLSQPMSFAFFF